MIALSQFILCGDFKGIRAESCIIPNWTDLAQMDRETLLDLVAHMELNAQKHSWYVEGKILQDAEYIRRKIG